MPIELDLLEERTFGIQTLQKKECSLTEAHMCFGLMVLFYRKTYLLKSGYASI